MSIALFLLNFLFASQTAILPTTPATAVVHTVVAPPLLPARPVKLQPALPSHLPRRLPYYTVTATVYTPSVAQTDDEPFVTADNSRIPANHSSRTRWVALSRDLLKRWGGPLNFGDVVRISGLSPALDGVYTVHDTMNRRHRHCIDVLMNEREVAGRMDDLDFGRWEKVRITKVSQSKPEWSEG